MSVRDVEGLRYRCTMLVDLLTREYPPEVYGGAGVHVAELVRALRRDIDVRVRCFGGPRDEAGTYAYPTPAEFATANAALASTERPGKYFPAASSRCSSVLLIPNPSACMAS